MTTVPVPRSVGSTGSSAVGSRQLPADATSQPISLPLRRGGLPPHAREVAAARVRGYCIMIVLVLVLLYFFTTINRPLPSASGRTKGNVEGTPRKPRAPRGPRATDIPGPLVSRGGGGGGEKAAAGGRSRRTPEPYVAETLAPLTPAEESKALCLGLISLSRIHRMQYTLLGEYIRIVENLLLLSEDIAAIDVTSPLMLSLIAAIQKRSASVYYCAPTVPPLATFLLQKHNRCVNRTSAARHVASLSVMSFIQVDIAVVESRSAAMEILTKKMKFVRYWLVVTLASLSDAEWSQFQTEVSGLIVDESIVNGRVISVASGAPTDPKDATGEPTQQVAPNEVAQDNKLQKKPDEATHEPEAPPTAARATHFSIWMILDPKLRTIIFRRHRTEVPFVFSTTPLHYVYQPEQDEDRADTHYDGGGDHQGNHDRDEDGDDDDEDDDPFDAAVMRLSEGRRNDTEDGGEGGGGGPRGDQGKKHPVGLRGGRKRRAKKRDFDYTGAIVEDFVKAGAQPHAADVHTRHEGYVPHDIIRYDPDNEASVSDFLRNGLEVFQELFLESEVMEQLASDRGVVIEMIRSIETEGKLKTFAIRRAIKMHQYEKEDHQYQQQLRQELLLHPERNPNSTALGGMTALEHRLKLKWKEESDAELQRLKKAEKEREAVRLGRGGHPGGGGPDGGAGDGLSTFLSPNAHKQPKPPGEGRTWMKDIADIENEVREATIILNDALEQRTKWASERLVNISAMRGAGGLWGQRLAHQVLKDHDERRVEDGVGHDHAGTDHNKAGMIGGGGTSGANDNHKKLSHQGRVMKQFETFFDVVRDNLGMWRYAYLKEYCQRSVSKMLCNDDPKNRFQEIISSSAFTGVTTEVCGEVFCTSYQWPSLLHMDAVAARPKTNGGHGSGDVLPPVALTNPPWYPKDLPLVLHPGQRVPDEAARQRAMTERTMALQRLQVHDTGIGMLIADIMNTPALLMASLAPMLMHSIRATDGAVVVVGCHADVILIALHALLLRLSPPQELPRKPQGYGGGGEDAPAAAVLPDTYNREAIMPNTNSKGRRSLGHANAVTVMGGNPHCDLHTLIQAFPAATGRVLDLPLFYKHKPDRVGGVSTGRLKGSDVEEIRPTPLPTSSIVVVHSTDVELYRQSAPDLNSDDEIWILGPSAVAASFVPRSVNESASGVAWRLIFAAHGVLLWKRGLK